MLRDEIYDRARLARDSRFDGQFYVAVKTTGIYCRPICPANSPKRENIDFYPSAAAAGEAGFRPCLRCRPESAPGTPAWGGTSTTVRRGLRLIASGALDDGNIESLADRLGVTSRHLRRLFSKHLGASPLAVAHTQRLHFAKQLINETSLPMRDVSLAAGYGSVRRFNDTFRKTYGKTPRELRRVEAAERQSSGDAALRIRLAYRTPFNWHAMLNFFTHRATPGVEEVDGQVYRRTMSFEGSHGIIEVQPDQKHGYLSLSLSAINTDALFDTVQSAREVFDLGAPAADINEALGKDSALKKMLRKQPGIRVPGAWRGFELTVRAILGQQISVKGATTIAGRIANRYGEKLSVENTDRPENLSRLFPTPDVLARARFNDIGLIRSRAQTIRSLAQAVKSGDVSFETNQDPTAFCENLKSIRGIGDWTAQYVSMRALKNPDAFPASDLALLKVLAKPARMTPKELEARAENWRPWRAYAAMTLWSALASSGG